MSLKDRSAAGALVPLFSVLLASHGAAASYIQLGGPATGFAAISNFKNSGTRNAIEGRDSNGDPDPNHNGLPDYANYQMANGNYTAIIAGPQSSTSDYSAFGSFSSGFGGSSLTVNNQTITQPDFPTIAAGRIDYDNALVSGVGTETVPVSALTFNFNTYAWDGNVTSAQTGDSRSNFDASYADPGNPRMISPFSPVHTPYNDGSGAGNAPLFYEIGFTPLTGAGLTFVDGQLADMDFSGTVAVSAFVAPFATFGSLDYTGTLAADGLGYEFDVSGSDSQFVFSDVNFVMNRAGSASVVPEPSSFLLLTFAALGAIVRRRRA